MLAALVPTFILSSGCVCGILLFTVAMCPCAFAFSFYHCDLWTQNSIPPLTPVSRSWTYPILGLFPGLFIHPGNLPEASDEGILDRSK